jgi:hypothetical protein
MKPRIANLMNEAMPFIDWKARNGVELNNGERNKWYADWFEKFADLIINECHEVIVVGGVDDLDGVKKHFEIE